MTNELLSSKHLISSISNLASLIEAPDENNVKDLYEVSSKIKQLKLAISLLENNIQKTTLLKFKDKFDELRSITGKELSAKLNILEDDFEISYSATKTVKYDADKLKLVANKLPIELTRNILKVDLSIPEKEYAALPTEFKDLINEARTVTVSNPKITICPKEPISDKGE